MGPQAAAELIQAAAAFIAAARIVQLRLAKQYPALLSYITFLALLNAVLGVQNSDSRQYYYSYEVFEPIKCLFGIMAVRELFALIFDDYPGIRTLGRWAMYTGITIAVLISYAGSVWTGKVHGSRNLFYLEASQRWVIFTLALVIVTILWFISRYPLHLSRNTLFSCACFSAIFLSDAFRLFIDSLAPYLYNLRVDRAESGFECLCLLTWAALLRRADDKKPPPPPPRSPHEEHLLEQLEAMNQLLTHASR